ncbi:Dihydrofolate reductase [Aquicella siphonis]|uniref:Dihydrofolate reductase n=1 Tax=Aquicella siphonis TaxID=254247 RepID=A0A5E4PIG0_9COXI|nr:dihydrofolate reductase [Aquicella siphonis]VVC76850.1 Dihydrofolate reductase [Aquicella siphonis]
MQRPMLSAIAAMSDNRVIGSNNQLPWRLPADLRHFKTLTSGHPILMGRKTYESIGRPLPHRTNIIMTRNAALRIPGCIVVTSFKEALAHAAAEDKREVFIIGGAEIYQQSLPYLDRIYLTIVHENFSGDAFFPELDPKDWKQVAITTFAPDDENPYSYSFVTLEPVSKPAMLENPA